MTEDRWIALLRATLTERLSMKNTASRTRWREYVRVVLIKIRAARKLAEPKPGERLHGCVGRALAHAGHIASFGEARHHG